MNQPHALSPLLTQAARVRSRRGIERTAHPTGPLWCDLASNDYLGLSKDPRVIEAAHCALGTWGTSARASRVVTGTTTAHQQAEDALAQLTGTESGLVFSAGYTANLAVLAALGRPGTSLLMDEHVHASLHDGARLSAASVTFFEHNKLVHLRNLLEEQGEKPSIIVTEGIFSVLGDSAPVRELLALATEYRAVLVVDESHSLGVLGAGAGICRQEGISGANNLLITSSLGKALGSMGGVLLGPTEFRDYFVNTARTFIFDTALAPANAAAAYQAARIIQAEGTDLTHQLFTKAHKISSALNLQQSSGAVQSLPLTAGSQQAAKLAGQLAAAGVSVGCFRPPAVPDGISRLRFTACADTEQTTLNKALALVTELLETTTL
ncbi:MAG: aminotransferase class I/II-fold pyridoxal phosphate-dependent enzyme [Rothia sp. (in: high G+C Gram-positive bacteria)]|nr:aminotransferase class I/II-fold pyridoxal phosphate-dependent enzyme [Rothia sp. (in: high G+C Gram-positive bacteria)]